MFVHFLLTAAIAAVLYAGGELAAAAVIRSAAAWVANAAQWPCGWPVRRSSAWRSAWW